MPTQSLKSRMTTWEVLSNNLGAQIAELPHLRADQIAFAQLIEEGVALESRQGVETSAIRRTNQLRNQLALQGAEMYERLGDALRHVFGPTNLRLLEFGLRPRAPRRRRPQTTEPTEPTPQEEGPLKG